MDLVVMAMAVAVAVVVLVLVWSRPCVAVGLGVGGGVEGEVEEVVRRHLRWLVTSAECGGGRGWRRGCA